ncbi:hypothetical protein C8R43DRAFT_892158, partial [Mycena crocata]
IGTNLFHWENGGAILQYVTTQGNGFLFSRINSHCQPVILCLRLYAMYGRSRKVLAALVSLLISEVAALVIFFEIPKAGLIMFICADADPPHVHWMAYVPVIMLTTESIFLGLALFKVLDHFPSGTYDGGRIIPRLTRQSVLFFFGVRDKIFIVHLANLVVWMINTLTVNELLTGYSFAIPAVLANRLLISVREQIEPADTVFSHGSINFARAVNTGATEETSETTFELENIRHGCDA